MSRRRLSDEQFEALLGSLDVAARQLLLGPEVDRAREALGDALLAEINSAATIRAAVPVDGGGGRFRTRVAAMGLTALVLAAAGLVVAALLPGRDSRTAPIGPAPASAAASLERAAGTASRQPAAVLGPGQLEHVMMIEGLTSSSYARDVSGKLAGVRFWQTDTVQTWGNAAGIHRMRTEDIRERFFSPADRAIARSHHMSLGKLDHIDGASAAPGNDSMFLAKDPGSGAERPYIAYAWSTLPTRPAALLDALERLLRAERPHPTAADLPAEVFNAVSRGLLFDAPSPALRSALYEVLAHLPGVQLLGWRRDPLDRRGIAITIKPAGPGNQNTREVMLLDPNMAEELGVEFVRLLSSPQPHAPTFPSGTLVSYVVFVERGIVDSITDPPGGRHLSTAGATKVVYAR